MARQTPTPARAKRQQKTPRQRAEEALGVAERRVKKLTEQTTAAKKAVSALEGELAEAKGRHEFLSGDPALRADGQNTAAVTS